MSKVRIDFSGGLGEDRLAEHSGICPLCSKYILKNRSRVVLLPQPLVPRGDGYRSYHDGGHYHGGTQGPISMHPRRWAHARCGERYMRERAER